MDRYTYNQFVCELSCLSKEFFDLLKVRTDAVTCDGRILYEVVLGNEAADSHVLVHGGIHAREYMTSKLLIAIMREYMFLYKKEQVYQDWLHRICFHIIPMINPDGITICQEGILRVKDHTLRKALTKFIKTDAPLPLYKANAHGVDLNRNFDWGFYEYEGSSSPAFEKFKGIAPACEAETSFLCKRTREIRPVFTLSYHASGSELFWDYGQTGELRDKTFTLVNKISEVTGYVIRYSEVNPQDAAGYGDWCVMREGIPSVTIEIGRGEAPLHKEEFDRIFKENRMLFYELTKSNRIFERK